VNADNPDWKKQLQIQSEVDLDSVIGQGSGYPVGMESKSPAEGVEGAYSRRRGTEHVRPQSSIRK
jgi:hypothetical protein